VTDLSVTEAQARAALVEVVSYDLVLDLTATPMRSRAEVRFRCRQPGTETFADLTVAATHSAVLNSEPVGPQVAGRLRLTGLRADNVLTVEADVADDVFTRFTDPADGAAYLFVTTFPEGAAGFMPCFDQPDLGATVTITLRARAGWQCFSSGAVADRTADGEWRFAPVQGLEPYLLVLCAGPFATRASTESARVPISVATRQSLTDVTGLDQFAATAARAVMHYEDLLGVPCPDPKYDIVFVPGLTALAVSVPGLMLVNETLLARMTDPDDDFAAMVCAHEVAHLWFGSHVSMRWWDDLWLDEAMATYLSNAEYWTAFGYRSKASAYWADGLPSTEPVSAPVVSSAQALSRPPAITYTKGAAVIRQLGALIGDDAMNAGLTDYLTRFGGSTTMLDDLVGCWSRAAGRDLAGWAQEWLRTSGTSVLRPEISVAGDLIESVAVVQEEASRTHLIGLGLYDLDTDGRLRQRRVLRAEISGARTVVPALAGERTPDVIVLNDGDLGYARVRFDPASRLVLTAAAMDVGEPLTEAVCWNSFWDMVTSGEFAAAEFAGLVGRRLRSGSSGLPLAAVEVLLERATAAADVWAHPALRAGLRERLAGAAHEAAAAAAAAAPAAAAAAAAPGSPLWRALAYGFAGCAESAAQLAVLRDWIDPAAPVDADLRARALRTLAARGLASGQEIDALASLDPVAGEVNRATCLAVRPSAAAKADAWAAALSDATSWRLAQAHASGIWVPGQESVLGGLDYFGAALPALAGRDARTQRRLAHLLFPATLVSEATIGVAEEWLAKTDGPAALRAAVEDQATAMYAVLAARRLAGGSI
jgi:aminopeptidase N